MPIRQINRLKEIPEKQLSVFGSKLTPFARSCLTFSQMTFKKIYHFNSTCSCGIENRSWVILYVLYEGWHLDAIYARN